MAVGSKDLTSKDMRGFDDERLVDELRKAKEELFNLRFQSATGQLDNHGRLRAVRKDIALLNHLSNINDGSLVNTSILIGAAELGQSIYINTVMIAFFVRIRLDNNTVTIYIINNTIALA